MVLKFESSATETQIESLKMASRSVGFGEEDDDNDVMVEKHESGYRVTLHTALMMIESAELDDGDLGGSVVYSWTSNPKSEPRVRDIRKMAKMETAVRRDFSGSSIWVLDLGLSLFFLLFIFRTFQSVYLV